MTVKNSYFKILVKIFVLGSSEVKKGFEKNVLLCYAGGKPINRFRPNCQQGVPCVGAVTPDLNCSVASHFHELVHFIWTINLFFLNINPLWKNRKNIDLLIFDYLKCGLLMRSRIGNPRMSKFVGACFFQFGPINYVLYINTDKQITRFLKREIDHRVNGVLWLLWFSKKLSRIFKKVKGGTLVDYRPISLQSLFYKSSRLATSKPLILWCQPLRRCWRRPSNQNIEGLSPTPRRPWVPFGFRGRWCPGVFGTHLSPHWEHTL